MQITLYTEKVWNLMQIKNYTHRGLWKELKDVEYGSFLRLMKGQTKQKTHLHITVRIAQALNVPVEEIIKEIK